MEFWGAEVKSGEPLKVAPGDGMVLHLSQACIGEVKKDKGNESIYLSLTVDGKKLVLGTLFTEKLPQQNFDLLFDRDFELSHNWKSGSVYFFGYKANNPFDEDDAASEEKEPTSGYIHKRTGKPMLHPEDDDSADDHMFSDGLDDSDSEDEEDDSSASEDSTDDSDESDEETPKKVEPSKKRSADSATKTPVPEKKAKATPQKTDGKKGGAHVATPHPSKKAEKTEKSSAKKTEKTEKTPTAKKADKIDNQQTPKSAGGSHSCTSCKKAFGSEKALESHSKAKHGGEK